MNKYKSEKEILEINIEEDEENDIGFKREKGNNYSQNEELKDLTICERFGVDSCLISRIIIFKIRYTYEVDFTPLSPLLIQISIEF
ncbi:hypothetical protein RB653_001142 [Dictyostelium firmibasis]|uniref:Uncharacterized protein n=1 Tax=Dictyostelium firmibasis TaxID=79012 RepID=A0AAN7TWG9_9MYCE